MTQDLEEKCSDDDKECQKRADFMKNDDQETKSDTIGSSKEMKLEYELEEENAEGDAMEDDDDDNEEEEEEGSGEEQEEDEEEEEIEEGGDEPDFDEETPEEDPSYEDETEDEDQDDDGASQEGVPLDDNFEDDTTIIINGTTTTSNANDTLSLNVSSGISPREFVPVAKPVPPMKGTVVQPPRKWPRCKMGCKGMMHPHHTSRVIVNQGIAKPYVVGTVNGIPVPAVPSRVIPPAKVPIRKPYVVGTVNGIPVPAVPSRMIPPAKVPIVPRPIPPPLVMPPVIPPSPPHMHFGQRFGGYYADGGLMGPGNWQARNWFSIGTLRKDGVRFNGACCGNTCRNGGRIGCCGKCPNCLDCPY